MACEGYDNNRAWSDAFLPNVRRLVGQHLLEVSSFEQDTKECADLVVVSEKGMRIAVRMRRSGYEDIYPHDFTIRYQSQFGTYTEIKKIIADGFGDWMFYGHASNNGEIKRWMLIDLQKFRDYWKEFEAHGGAWSQFIGAVKENLDRSRFVVFDIRKMPHILIDGSHISEYQRAVAA